MTAKKSFWYWRFSARNNGQFGEINLEAGVARATPLAVVEIMIDEIFDGWE